MGTSTDAIHFWGVCWSDEEEPRWPWLGELDADGDWEPFDDPDDEGGDWLSEHLGGPKYIPGAPGNYWAERDAFLAKHFGVGLTFGLHCSYDYAMRYLAVDATHTVASRGYPEAVAQPPVEEAWVEALKKLSEITGVDLSGTGWWICSMWG